MNDNEWIAAYLGKADESLAGAQSEYDSGRFNNSANRAYFAAFQAAISALVREGIWRNDGNRPHTFVQSEFAGRLINRRHRYPTGLPSTLSDLQRFRHGADYRHAGITRTQIPLCGGVASSSKPFEQEVNANDTRSSSSAHSANGGGSH